MGAAAIQPPDQLRESGVENDRAESEAQAKTQFVTADEYHKRDRTLATRDDLNTAIATLRVEFRAEMAEVRADIRAIYHLLIGGFVTIVAGIAVLVAKAFIGV